MSTQPMTPPPDSTESEAKSPVWKLQGIFFEPTRTFEEIDRKPNFVLPLICIVVISLLASMYIFSIIDMEQVIRIQIRNGPQGDQMTEEQIDQAVATFRDTPLGPIIQYGGPVLFPIIFTLVVAGLTLMLVTLTGGESSYGKLFSSTAHGYFFWAIVSSVLTLIVFSLAEDPYAVDLQNPVSSNLGVLVSQKESPALYRLASSVDIVVFYVIYLVGLGASKVSRGVSKAKGITLIGAMYAVYALLAVGWNALIA